jgi:hypothetical protein
LPDEDEHVDREDQQRRILELDDPERIVILERKKNHDCLCNILVMRRNLVPFAQKGKSPVERATTLGFLA